MALRIPTKLALLVLLCLGSARTSLAVVDLSLDSCIVVQDVCPLGGGGGGNLLVEPGEVVRMDLLVFNAGDEPATNGNGLVTALTPGVTMLQDMTMFPPIPGPGSATGLAQIGFMVADTVPCGTDLMFQLDMQTDQQRISTTCTVPMPMNCLPCVAGPMLQLDSCVPTDTCALGGPGDGNGIVEPGETATIAVSFVNNGAMLVTNVNGMAFTTTPGVTVTQPATAFGDIAPAAVAVGVPEIEIAVDLTVPCGTSIDIGVALTTDQGPAGGTCQLPIPPACTGCTAAPVLVVADCAAMDDCPMRGSNGVVDPGETATIDVRVMNQGGADATNVTAMVTTTTPGVTVTVDTTSFGTVPAGGAAGSATPIEIAASVAVPCGTDIVLDFAFQTDQGPQVGTCTISVPPMCRPCSNGPVLSLSSCMTTDTCPSGGPGDGDGAVDPGEMAFMRLMVQNMGPAAGTNVTATVTSSSPGVTITQGMTTFGTVPIGGNTPGAPAIEFMVDATVACGTDLIFDVAISSDQGGFNDTCQVRISSTCTPCGGAAPILSVDNCLVVGDSCVNGGAGHADGNVDPGESATIDIVLRNDGTDATNVDVMVSTATAGVTITQPAATYGTITMGSMVTGTPSIQFDVAGTVACGTTITLDVAISSDQGATADSCPVDVPMPCTPCVAGSTFTLQHVSSAVAADSCAMGGPGDANGAIDPGETIQVNMDVMNAGPGDTTGVMGTLTAVTAGVTVTTPMAAFGDIAALAMSTSQTAFEFTVDLNMVACGDALTFQLDLVANEGPSPSEMVGDLSVAMPCDPCMAVGAVDEVPWLITRCVGGQLEVEWMPAPGAVTYGIHQGTIGVFEDPAAPDYDHGCVQSGLVAPLMAFVPTITCGDGLDLYFLVVGLDAADQEGPYGFTRPAGMPTCP